MADPRFARFSTDPRFRRPRKRDTKVVVDDRFKEIFSQGKKKPGKAGRVDKYGRPTSETQDQDNLRRFYRLEHEEKPEVTAGPDYARGEVLLESSDEEDTTDEDGTDTEGEVTLGLVSSKPIALQGDESDAEIDLDETHIAELDAQAAAYNSGFPQEQQVEGARSCRLALVNIDWDHVRATHLFKIFSSLVSPTAPSVTSSSSGAVHSDRQKFIKGGSSSVARGKVLSVRVYPSEFGRTRLEQEEKEGPPAEIFKKRGGDDDEEVNEQNIYEVGDENDYDEDALRKYQLERLRYYYAIITCDTVEAASHIYAELDGTELERSANVFDLSFVPDDMTFDGESRDEATEDSNNNYKSVDYVTDALRHSKVKLTWDEDDPERTQITRRTLSKQEIEEADFKAYIASSTSGSESEVDQPVQSNKRKDRRAISRDKLRNLLLGGGDDGLPEGWGREDDVAGDVDMEITFTPGISGSRQDKDETTLDKYQKKMKEKRKKRKEEVKAKATEKIGGQDDFFDMGSEGETKTQNQKNVEKGRPKNPKNRLGPPELLSRKISTPDELALLVGSDDPITEPKHFNLKSILKAEKKTKLKRRKGRKDTQEDAEIQEDFAVDVKDDRFKALHDDHAFAIDPSNPHFKKTKSMAALLEERQLQRKAKLVDGSEVTHINKASGDGDKSLQSLVASVKRKSIAIKQDTNKRRRL